MLFSERHITKSKIWAKTSYSSSWPKQSCTQTVEFSVQRRFLFGRHCSCWGLASKSDIRDGHFVVFTLSIILMPLWFGITKEVFHGQDIGGTEQKAGPSFKSWGKWRGVTRWLDWRRMFIRGNLSQREREIEHKIYRYPFSPRGFAKEAAWSCGAMLPSAGQRQKDSVAVSGSSQTACTCWCLSCRIHLNKPDVSFQHKALLYFIITLPEDVRFKVLFFSFFFFY